MQQQNNYNNQRDKNPNKLLLRRFPICTPSQSTIPVYNLDYRTPFIRPNNEPALRNPIALPCNNGHLNYQNRSAPPYQNINTFPPLPDNIDEEYILKYLCPAKTAIKDETFNVWFENWIASKGKKIPTPNSKSTNVEIHKVSSKLKRCKILLESIKNNKQLMETNILTMNETEWKKACSNLSSIKKQIDAISETLNLDNNSMLELKLKLAKRKSKRARLKRVKSNIKIVKSQQKNKVEEVNRKIDAWQNSLKKIILNENMVNERKIEANIVLKGVEGKIDDAKNQLSLYDTLVKLRKFRLQNCIDKKKNPFLEESLNKLKILWQQKLKDYYKEEEELKNMLSQGEAKKTEKREIEIQEKLAEWDLVFFGPNIQSQEIILDDLHTFIDNRKAWDKYVVSESETPICSGIPIGWIVPPKSCNSDWAKYLNNVL